MRVRFSKDVNLEPEKVHVEPEGPNPARLPEAHVGLLIVHHGYEVTFPVDHSFGKNVVIEHPQHNICVTTVSVSEAATTEDGKFKHVIKILVKTLKDGHLEEKIRLMSEEDESKGMDILVTATIIAAGKGIPLLKDGVRVVSHEHAEESDLSDWHGHKIIA